MVRKMWKQDSKSKQIQNDQLWDSVWETFLQVCPQWQFPPAYVCQGTETLHWENVQGDGPGGGGGGWE